MKALDSLLNAQFLAIFVCLGAVAMAVRLISAFSSEAANLRPRLAKAEQALKQMRERLDRLRPTIDELEERVEPLRTKEQHLRDYYDQLKEIELAEMRREAEEQREKEGKDIRRRGTLS